MHIFSTTLCQRRETGGRAPAATSPPPAPGERTGAPPPGRGRTGPAILLSHRRIPMANKRERQATIREIIESRPVESQEELRRLLLQRGWDVTQSTLSRDLREMRVARMPTPEGSVRYAVADGGQEASSLSLEALLPHLYTDIDGVGEMIVLHT